MNVSKKTAQFRQYFTSWFVSIDFLFFANGIINVAQKISLIWYLKKCNLCTELLVINKLKRREFARIKASQTLFDEIDPLVKKIDH
jgi:hypothetical protein